MRNPVGPVREGPRDLVLLTFEGGVTVSRRVARAFIRCGFSEDEWARIDDAPLRAFLYVATVDGPVRPAEREACRRELERGLLTRSPLVGRVCQEALHRLEAPGEALFSGSERAGVEWLRPLCERVAERLGLGEASRFQRLLLDVGQRVARASGGLLGRLGRIRREERRALDSLADALGLPVPRR